jgi:hypothetical protein
VSLDDKKISNPDSKLNSGLLKVGKKRFINIVVK